MLTYAERDTLRVLAAHAGLRRPVSSRGGKMPHLPLCADLLYAPTSSSPAFLCKTSPTWLSRMHAGAILCLGVHVHQHVRLLRHLRALLLLLAPPSRPPRAPCPYLRATRVRPRGHLPLRPQCLPAPALSALPGMATGHTWWDEGWSIFARRSRTSHLIT
ncbi:hypothetical protein OH76DRAFT_1184595 [Lentinus brumalis]|uniref:Uncharacterized protein n=1 Tax=Lentinus brumalis TaxID=2498619 RepID=A0A371CU21_9APHY|nr:hypothetical protein OH76DRAFT_1184595 [Polyporus brumalis]